MVASLSFTSDRSIEDESAAFGTSAQPMNLLMVSPEDSCFNTKWSSAFLDNGLPKPDCLVVFEIANTLPAAVFGVEPNEKDEEIVCPCAGFIKDLRSGPIVFKNLSPNFFDHSLSRKTHSVTG